MGVTVAAAGETVDRCGLVRNTVGGEGATRTVDDAVDTDKGRAPSEDDSAAMADNSELAECSGRGMESVIADEMSRRFYIEDDEFSKGIASGLY